MPNLEEHLQLTSVSFIKIKGNREAYTNHYGKLRDTLYSKLKEEQPLRKWLCGHRLVGSYADNLKVTQPDEFDLVIYLKFPENDRIVVKKDYRNPGNVTLDLTEVLDVLHNQYHNKVTFTNLKKLVTAKNLLLEDKLQDLINSAVRRALNKMKNKIEVDGKISKLMYKRCGPAHTIFIDDEKFKYSVDFVPAIRLNKKQNIITGEKLKYFKAVSHWNAIPKPLKPFEPNNVSFRASYFEAEYAMLKDKYKLKDVIKFMKKFRDTKQNISTLKSYYIKTLLLWQVDIRPEKYWETKPLNQILIDMFRELADCLTCDCKLLSFWDPNLNLFAALTQNQQMDMLNCINTEINTLSQAMEELTEEISECVTTSFSNRQERCVKNQTEAKSNSELSKEPSTEMSKHSKIDPA